MMEPTTWPSPDAPVDVSGTTVCQPATGTDDEDEAPAADPEYADLFDAKWLERVADAQERDDDLVDVGLTLDLDDCDDAGELAQGMDLDVGVLLTSLPAPVSAGDGDPSELTAADGAASRTAASRSAASESAETELGGGSLSVGALSDVLLPEGRALRAEDDDEIGEDEHFPAFDVSPLPGPTAPGVEDDSAEGDA